MSTQEEKRSALASISALMPWWFLMTRSAEDTSLGAQRPHHLLPTTLSQPSTRSPGGNQALWVSPAAPGHPSAGSPPSIHSISSRTALKKRNLSGGVQQQLAAGSGAP